MREKMNAGGAYEAAVAYLCAHIGELSPPTGSMRWNELLTVVRETDPGDERWRSAVRGLHEDVEERIPGGLGLDSLMGWPPRPPSAGGTLGWVCPTGICGRAKWLAEPALETPAAPSCGLNGEDMRRIEA